MKKLLFYFLAISIISLNSPGQTLSYPFTNGSLLGLTQFGSNLTQTIDRINSPTNAVDLNGDYLRSGAFTDFSFTMSFWINTTTNDANKRTIIDHSNKNSNFDNASDAGWYTYLKSGKVGLAANYWHTHDFNGSPQVNYSGYYYTEATTNIADGYWHNVIVTAQMSIVYFNGWLKRYTYNIYIDGVLENTQTIDRGSGSSSSNINAGLVITAKAMTIANNNSSNLTDRYQDNIDDIKYYNSVVTSTVINVLANENRCTTPSNINFTTLSSSSAVVSWNNNTDALSWDLTYVPSGQSINTGSVISAISANTTTITGLNQSTTYDVYIKSNCTGFSGWWSIPNAFTTLCPSTFATAIAQNYTVQLNAYGTSTISTTNIDNGSLVDCGAINLSLSKSVFSCSDVGVNSVTLTATDNQGNISTANANVTVLGIINDENLAVNQSKLCAGSNATISINSSMNGVQYSLRNDATNSQIGTQVLGNGGPIAFNTGSLTTTTTFNILGQKVISPFGLNFDGVNDYVNASITPSFNYNQAFTYEAWLKTPLPGSAGGRCIFSVGNSSQTDIEIYIQPSSNRLTVVYNRYKSGVTTSGGVYTVPPNNTWFHLAVTYDGTATKVYFNGVQQTIFQTLAGNALQKTTGAQMGLGYYKASATHPSDGWITYSGTMDDVRLWETVRTQSEIQNNMNSCAVAAENGLINYYNFDDGVGTSASDIISGNNGTLTNIATPANNWVTGYINCGSSTCGFEMTQIVTINVNPTPTISVNSGSICSGNSFTISPTGANSYTIQGGSAIKTPTTSSSYTVAGTNSVGCVSSAFSASSITVNALPFVNATTSNSLLCVGQSAILTANGASTYTWNPSENGTTISITPSITTNYSLSGTDLNGCVNTSSFTQSVTICTGIEKSTNIQNEISLFPNPTSSQISITSTEEIKSILIFNSIGALVQTEKTNLFSITQLPNGIYVTEIRTENGTTTTRFIKQ
jgi:hypothetical protein